MISLVTVKDNLLLSRKKTLHVTLLIALLFQSFFHSWKAINFVKLTSHAMRKNILENEILRKEILRKIFIMPMDNHHISSREYLIYH